ncbi:4-amino-4-deoxy-L-arabinose transferase [Desulfatibacillum aliphaticivorans]|uniref:4-amino-4-deoxy-L-arabinose transferase n=1 Tax=Desulfatibacillum aliphaticivorans TaxID=218208 RepID=B8FJ18_DESAL|nr:glycosyltransferase family 39 protein [Desulfatibacillum aliphaticivorans]ACL04945.1 4-amino-4-deoxy-L-arabinose transferase [Desulfatibacillum aliphaticivorans]
MKTFGFTNQGGLSKYTVPTLVFTLLAVHFLLGASSAIRKSNTYDEIVHITAGFSNWTQQDHRVDPVSGALPKGLAALPLLFMDLSPPDPLSEDVFTDFLYNPANPTDQMLFWARLMIMLLSMCLGYAVFLWSRNLFGVKAGLFSLALYCFSPTVLAHARLATSDLAAALFFVLSLGALQKLLNRPGLCSSLLAGLALGCLMASKLSFLIIFPAAAVLMIMHWAGKGRKRGDMAKCLPWMAFALALAISTVWALYGFRFYAAPEGGLSLAAGSSVSGIWALLIKTKFFPESFIMGLWDVFHKLSLRDGFMNGAYSITGWVLFFPFCMAVKTPEPIILIAALAAGALFLHRRDSKAFQARPLWVFVLVYMAMAMSVGVNIGHRYLLPMYPAVFILAGALIHYWGDRPRLRIAAPACLLILIAQSLWIWPHYLSFFNGISGGPGRGYERLVDSSLDWGQDLPALKEWQDQKTDDLPVYLSYFGTALPEHFGVHAEKIAPMNLDKPGIPALKPGWYCISATYLKQVYTGALGPYSRPFEAKYQEFNQLVHDLGLGKKSDPSPVQAEIISKFRRARFARLCHVLGQRRPDAMAAYSICIYKVDQSELHRALFEPMARLPKTRMVKGAGDYTLF